MNQQTTEQLLMIRPSCFYTNDQTAKNNYFQQQTDEDHKSTTEKAQHKRKTRVSIPRKPKRAIRQYTNKANETAKLKRHNEKKH